MLSISSSWIGLAIVALLSISPLTPNAAAIQARVQESDASLSIKEERGTGINGMGFASIALAVYNYLKPNNAWDPIVPNKCAIVMQTYSGGNCETYLQCDQTDAIGSSTGVWEVCYLGGRQYFTDPHIGDYSITFTEAGGVDGNTEDGLHHPVLQLANVNNWEPIHVQELSDAAKSNTNGGNVCGWTQVEVGDLAWICGVPVVGDDGAFGISSDTIVHESGYSPGWCTFHIRQWQRNENGVNGTFAFDIILYDAKKAPIGQVMKAPIDPGSNVLDMNSNLPHQIVVSVPNGGDDDPVHFAYGGETWQSDDNTHCSMGGGTDSGYESGSRQGDCGFTCS